MVLTKHQNDFKIELKYLEDDLLLRLSAAEGSPALRPNPPAHPWDEDGQVWEPPNTPVGSVPEHRMAGDLLNSV